MKFSFIPKIGPTLREPSPKQCILFFVDADFPNNWLQNAKRTNEHETSEILNFCCQAAHVIADVKVELAPQSAAVMIVSSSKICNLCHFFSEHFCNHHETSSLRVASFFHAVSTRGSGELLLYHCENSIFTEISAEFNDSFTNI